MKRSVWVFAAVLLVTSLTAMPTASVPDTGPLPTMNVSLEPPQVEAEVTQSEGGEVEFQGTVEVDQPQLLTSNLTIKCVMNTGWPVEVEPNGTEVTGPMTIHFKTTLEVPPATSSLLAGNMMLTASLKSPGLTAIHAGASAIVTVGQYHKLRIECSDPLTDLERGQNGQIEVNIYNDGNGQDTFDVSLEEIPDGIRASLGQNKVTVQQDEYETIIVDVTIEEDSPDVMHTITVRVTSTGSDGDYSRTYPVFVSVKTFSDNIKAPSVPIPIVIFTLLVATVLIRRRGPR